MSDADAAAKVAELQSGFRAAAEGMPFAARLVEMADATRAPPRTERDGRRRVLK